MSTARLLQAVLVDPGIFPTGFCTRVFVRPEPEFPPDIVLVQNGFDLENNYQYCISRDLINY